MGKKIITNNHFVTDDSLKSVKMWIFFFVLIIEEKTLLGKVKHLSVTYNIPPNYQCVSQSV